MVDTTAALSKLRGIKHFAENPYLFMGKMSEKY